MKEKLELGDGEPSPPPAKFVLLCDCNYCPFCGDYVGECLGKCDGAKKYWRSGAAQEVSPKLLSAEQIAQKLANVGGIERWRVILQEWLDSYIAIWKQEEILWREQEVSPPIPECVWCNQATKLAKRCHRCGGVLCDITCEEWHLEKVDCESVAEPSSPLKCPKCGESVTFEVAIHLGLDPPSLPLFVACGICNHYIGNFAQLPKGGDTRELKATIRWIPVEEQEPPKDGREVLLRVKFRAGIAYGTLVGHWMRGGHCIEDHPPIESGWYFWNGTMFDRAAEPTHWMALPGDEGL